MKKHRHHLTDQGNCGSTLYVQLGTHHAEMLQRLIKLLLAGIGHESMPVLGIIRGYELHAMIFIDQGRESMKQSQCGERGVDAILKLRQPRHVSEKIGERGNALRRHGAEEVPPFGGRFGLPEGSSCRQG